MAANDEQEIRALVMAWAEAARSRNMQRVLARHAEDIVMFDVPMPIQSRGIDAYRATWELFFGVSPGGPGSFELTELQITAGESVAYCHALIEVGDSTARLTMGLRRQHDGWVIAHEHHSYAMERHENTGRSTTRVALP